MINQSLYFTKPNVIEVRIEQAADPGKNEVLVQSRFSGISSGTEMLFYKGMVPDQMTADSNITGLNKEVLYPIKYGYSNVGKIVGTGEGVPEKFMDKWIFAFRPHQGYYCIEVNDLVFIPEDIPPSDALFFPNMETAVNLVMDGKPVIGEIVSVIGLGIVGILASSILRFFPVEKLITYDLFEKRRNVSIESGADFSFNPDDKSVLPYVKSSDLVYELSGNPDALNLAVDIASYESRIVVGSWYGKKEGKIDLGGKFHRNRMKIIGSQVSTISSEFLGRWNSARRYDVVWNMIRRIRPSSLISHKFHITDAVSAYGLLEKRPEEAMQVVFYYDELQS